jgi:hypothetical protein
MIIWWEKLSCCLANNKNSKSHNAILFFKQLSFASHWLVVYWKVGYWCLLHSLLSFTYYCRFSARDFLERLKGKKLMLVGDSMNRNQYESILCILREGLQNKSKMYEIHGHKISKGRGYFVFKFEVIFIFYCILRSVQAPITCPTLYYFFWGKNNPFSVIYIHFLLKLWLTGKKIVCK